MKKNPQEQTATDPVCGMPVTKPVLHATHEGEEYGFCSDECLQKFQTEPDRYARGATRTGSR